MSETPPVRPPEQLTPPEQTNTEIDIYFQKSKLFRVVHADGVWQNFGQGQTLRLVFYSEALPIPDKIIGQVSPNGQLLGDDIKRRTVINGVMREIEVDVVVNIPTIEEMIRTLKVNLDLLKKMK